MTVEITLDLRGDWIRGMCALAGIVDHGFVKDTIDMFLDEMITTYYRGENVAKKEVVWAGDLIWENDEWIRVQVLRLVYDQHKEDFPDEEYVQAESLMFTDLFKRAITDWLHNFMEDAG